MTRPVPRSVLALCTLYLMSTAGSSTAGSSTAGSATQEARLVTYGPEAAAAMGDDDHQQEIFIRVPLVPPEGEKLWLRLFDADCGGAHDDLVGGKRGTTRFSLFRGDQLLHRQELGERPDLDADWWSFAPLTVADGEADEEAVFRLLVEGTAGAAGNLFAVAVSRAEDRNLPAAGVRIESPSPTLRLPSPEQVAELRFMVPAGARSLAVTTFDAAGARATLDTAFRSLALNDSGQGGAVTTEVPLEPVDSGRPAAVVLGGGGETPNDVTFRVSADGEPLFFQLPIPLRRPNRRPLPRLTAVPLADCRSLVLDASASEDPDGDPLRFTWDLSSAGGADADGEEADGATVVHRFPGAGTWTLRATVHDDSGAVSSTASELLTVTVNQPPVAEISVSSRVVAPGEELRFDGSASRDLDGSLKSFLWSFGDGTSAPGPTLAHAFSEAGRYHVGLRVTDDSGSPCDWGHEQIEIRVNRPPVAEAGPARVLAVGETTTFDAASSYDPDGELTTYRWHLGDGHPSDGTVIEGARFEHAFSRPGSYDVELSVGDDSGASNAVSSDRVRVVVNAVPEAAAGDDRRLAVGETTFFDADASSDPDGAIVAYRWDFGDGRSAAGARVPYAYQQPGSYRVTLRVVDDSALATGTAIDTLKVEVNAPPVAMASGPPVVTASEVHFDASASSDADGEGLHYAWDFGDGSTGSGARPVHVYRQPGSYRARLAVSDSSGTIRNTAATSVLVRVNQRPIADAGADLVVAPGETVALSAAASLDPDGEVAEYRWRLAGDTLDGEEVLHTFAQPGLYSVELQVGDDTGDPRAVAYDEMQVRVNAPPVAVAGPDLRTAPGLAIELDASGSFDPDGAIVSYTWSLEGREIATGARLTRTFEQPGIFHLGLRVVDDSGAGNGFAEDEVTVRVNHPPSALAPADIVTCATVIELDASASSDPDGDPLTFEWDLGDGQVARGPRPRHVYQESGTYPLVVTVDDGSGLPNAHHSDTMEVRINHPPVADAGDDLTVCAGEETIFDGSRSADPDGGLLLYTWSFGDGASASGMHPTHVYEQGGSYQAMLEVEDESATACNQAADRLVVRVAESPRAVAGADRRVCANTSVGFDGSASSDFDGVVNRFNWSFGDGGTGGGPTPEHIFTEPGSYRVLLTVTGDQVAECDNTDSDEVALTVLAAPAPRITGPALVAADQGDQAPVTWSAATSSGEGATITGYRWDFGDGTPSADGDTVEHRYRQPGRYTLTMTLSTDGSPECATALAEQIVVVGARPMAIAGDDRLVSVGELVRFDGSSSSDDTAISLYTWDFGDGESAEGVEVRHRYARPGRYQATLTVTDDTDLANRSASDTIEVVVNAAPRPLIELGEAPCPGRELSLSAAGSSDADGDIVAFEWYFGDGTDTDTADASGPEARHTYPQPGEYALTLIADDGLGLANSRAQANLPLRVNRAPSAVAGPDRVICPGDSQSFGAGASRDLDGELSAYHWDFGDGQAADGAEALHAYSAAGSYDVVLTVTDDSGSSCGEGHDRATVRVNASPRADAGEDRQAYAGGAHDAILFDASASSDADGEALTFTWDFGDGFTAAGARVHHAYARPGSYTVTLSASDPSGLACARASDQVVVVVVER